MKILYNGIVRNMTAAEEADVADKRTDADKLEALIRAKYSLEEEVRLIRDSDEAKDEYKAYRKYCKECEKAIKKANK